MSWDRTLFLSLILVMSADVSAQQTYLLENATTRVVFGINPDGLELNSYSLGETHFFIPPDELTPALLTNNPLGSQLQLYRSHPLESDEAFSLPESYSIQNAKSGETSTTSLQLIGQNEQFEVLYQIQLHDVASLLSVTTTITNRSGETIEFFPVEQTAFSAEFGISNMPGFQTWLYTPVEVTENATDSLTFHTGDPQSDQFLLHTPSGVWETQYRNTITSISFNRGDDWVAVRSMRGKPSLGVEYQFPETIEYVEDNINTFTASGNAIVDASGFSHLSDENAYRTGFRLTHGKASLKPEKTYGYETFYSAGNLPVPIVDVSNGVMAYRPLEVYATDVFFEFLGVISSPVNGLAVVKIYDHEGKLLNDSPMPIVDPRKNVRTIQSEVHADFPVYISSRIQFGFTAEDVDAIRVEIVDENENFLFLLAEAQGPFPAIQE